MPIYAVLTKGADPLVSAALARAYPGNYYSWGSETFFLRTMDDPKAIGAALDVMVKDDSANITGSINNTVIFQLRRSYWGFAEPNLWSWLKTAFEGEAV